MKLVYIDSITSSILMFQNIFVRTIESNCCSIIYKLHVVNNYRLNNDSDCHDPR